MFSGFTRTYLAVGRTYHQHPNSVEEHNFVCVHVSVVETTVWEPKVFLKSRLLLMVDGVGSKLNIYRTAWINCKKLICKISKIL